MKNKHDASVESNKTALGSSRPNQPNAINTDSANTPQQQAHQQGRKGYPESGQQSAGSSRINIPGVGSQQQAHQSEQDHRSGDTDNPSVLNKKPDDHDDDPPRAQSQEHKSVGSG